MSVELDNIIQLIKNAKLPGENKALRVGTAFELLNTEKANKSESFTQAQTLDLINQVKALAITGSNFIGSITPTSTIPSGNVWAFAQTGTYPNANGIVIPSGAFGIISHIENTWSSVIIEADINSIEDIQKTDTVDLVDTYTIYMSDGSTFEFQVTNGDGNTGDLNSILKWFLEQTPDPGSPFKTYPITEEATNPILFGVTSIQACQLQKNNTTIALGQPAGVIFNVFQNLPIAQNNVSKIKVKIIPYLNNSPDHCTLLGVRPNGTIGTLILSENPNSLHDYEFNVSEFEFLSLGWVTVDGLADSFLQKIEFYNDSTGGGVVENIVKNYIDTKTNDIVIYTNRTLYPLKYGFKETNTEAQNKAILDNLINIAFSEARSIELPEGKYPISNVVMKPCHLYGKDRNTMLESKTAEPMFTMDPAWGIENINNHTTEGFKGGYYTGFEIAGFGLKGNEIATKGFWFGTHAFAHYDRLFFHGFSDVAIHTTGMLICTFGDIEIRKVQNGIRADMLGAYAANLVCFDYLNIESCKGIGVHWRNGSGIHFKRLDTEKIGTVGDVNTGSLFFESIYPDYTGMVGVTIDRSWAEDLNGGFYAKLESNASHSIKNTNILKLSSDAQNSIINNGGKLLVENIHIQGSGFGLVTSNGGQTLCQGFNTIPLHTEVTGGIFKTAQYL